MQLNDQIQTAIRRNLATMLGDTNLLNDMVEMLEDNMVADTAKPGLVDAVSNFLQTIAYSVSDRNPENLDANAAVFHSARTHGDATDAGTKELADDIFRTLGANPAADPDHANAGDLFCQLDVSPQSSMYETRLDLLVKLGICRERMGADYPF